MEEILCHGCRYTFILPSRSFTAVFDKIEVPNKTLIVTDYTDENGTVPGIRTMPFSWVKNVELVSIPNQFDIETIEMPVSPIVKKRKKKNKTPELLDNFMR